MTIFLIFLATFPPLSLQGRGRATEDKISSYGKSIKVRFATLREGSHRRRTHILFDLYYSLLFLSIPRHPNLNFDSNSGSTQTAKTGQIKISSSRSEILSPPSEP